MIALAQERPGQARGGGWQPVGNRRVSPLQAALQKAHEQEGDTFGFSMYPVFERTNAAGQQERFHQPVAFKQLKELKMACAQYGPTAPFTEEILESLALDAMPPADWKSLAKACLSGGDYLLWRTEFVAQCQSTAVLNRTQGIPITFEMLAGEGQYLNLEDQLQHNPAVYAQCAGAAKKAWRKLPTTKNSTLDLTKIRQGPDELYQDFVSRLMEAASKLIGDGEAGTIIVRQLAFENANAACQAALRPFRHKGTLSDYV